ncbi:ABC-2 transporter permease [Alkalihalobacillus trypoxylicola]|uniref:ABC-2 transporter permease n=1 Tax=Alkalihalobacillus trypoxylicola TaxID=519424 RepID=A0A162DG11_9BACI|nr:ABC-2 transporter permease [Alkalihalobacillus trypoxylicola]KYG29507.1 hypothetical protein AZF04_08280 [Alkalihalobacillus trypoxylicola]
MRGLVLNQYYTVDKSLKNYFFISVLLVAVMLLSSNDMLLSMATWVPIMFMISPAFEALKHESASGWNKFVLTFPIKRRHVVQSHYYFFLLLLLAGTMITFLLIFAMNEFIGGIQVSALLNSLMNGMGIAFIIGYVSYPLTYYYGTEKSDMILYIGVFSAIGIYIFAGWLFQQIISLGWFGLSVEGHIDLIFSLLFLVLNLIIFILSYFVTVFIYQKKEF